MHELQNPQKVLLLAALGVTTIQTLRVYALKKRLQRGRQNFNILRDSTMYLVNLIAEHDIELTEFDVIALNTISEG
jgi:hypothetical protein